MLTLEDGRTDAYMSKDGRIWGSYLHGIFDNEDLVFGLVHDIMKEKGIQPEENHLSVSEYKEIQYNKLADLIRKHLDMNQIYDILFGKKDSAMDENDTPKKDISEEDKVGCGGLKDDKSGKGCVHIYCGDGKGKTTCIMGLTVRAAGSGKKILLHQFLKDNDSSERIIIEKIPNITVIPGAKLDKFTFQMNEEELAQLHEENDKMLDRLIAMAGDYDMLVMDESVYAMSMGLLSEEKMIEFLKNRPEHLEVVMSGRNPSEKLQEYADYVSEIKKIKHPFDKGLSSRLGIEK